MKLYLVQHGKAASEDVDPQRGLTEQGRSEVQRVAAFIKPLDLSVEYLWLSEKKRAEQTAEILGRAIKAKRAAIHDGLKPNDDVKAFKKEISLANGDIMVVGHLPFLSKLATLLLKGNSSANTVAFKNGGIVCLGYNEEKRWQIEWLVTPELINYGDFTG